MNSLKSQLEDKEAIIAELSKHLESQTAPSTRRRGRHTASHDVTDNSDELNQLRKKVSAERALLSSCLMLVACSEG